MQKRWRLQGGIVSWTPWHNRVLYMTMKILLFIWFQCNKIFGIIFRQKFEQTATLSLPTKSNILAYHVIERWEWHADEKGTTSFCTKQAFCFCRCMRSSNTRLRIPTQWLPAHGPRSTEGRYDKKWVAPG